jgi:hypothetical protein
MNLPYETYQADLFMESVAIVNNQQSEYFQSLCIIPVPEGSTATRLHPVSLTNVHVISGETNPRLRKVEERNSRTPQGVAEIACQRAIDHIAGEIPVLSNNFERRFTEAVHLACETIDREERDASTPPFKTLGLLAVYLTDEAELSVTEFGSIDFFGAVGKLLPESQVDLSDPEAIPEAAYRMMYSVESEHKELPPFEQWKEQAKALVAGVDNVDGAFGYLSRLLLPRSRTSAVINKFLFDEAPAE